MDMYDKIPGHMKQGIAQYIMFGHEPGGFASAVIRDSLIGAAGHADTQNSLLLYEYASYMYNYMPTAARGENMEKWMEERRAEPLSPDEARCWPTSAWKREADRAWKVHAPTETES